MDKSKVIPLLIKTGWCVAMVDPHTNEPGMFWDKREERFDGLLTIDSIFEEQDEALKKQKGLVMNPYVSYKIFFVEHRSINGNISIELKR